jgi:hypothetical protein
MPSFTLSGETHEYLNSQAFGDPAEVRSWEYGHYPKVVATLSLTGGGSVDVYAKASRWSPTHISVSWMDDEQHSYWAWVPKDNVRPATDSEWDIDQYRRCPEHLRGIRWGKRLPGFLPA